MAYFVYIPRSVTNELYFGQTNNLEKRLQYHKSGNGALFTKVYKTSMLVYSEKFISRAEAMKRELQIKRWSRAKKEALIEGNFKKLKEL